MRLEIQTNDNQDSGAVGNSCPYPDRPGEPDCMYYLRTGLCGYGSKCKFNHPTSAGNVSKFLYNMSNSKPVIVSLCFSSF